MFCSCEKQWQKTFDSSDFVVVVVVVVVVVDHDLFVCFGRLMIAIFLGFFVCVNDRDLATSNLHHEKNDINSNLNIFALLWRIYCRAFVPFSA